MTKPRSELLRLFAEVSDEAPDRRLEQLVANLATLAQGAQVEAIWDAEDDELIAAAERLLDHYRQRASDVAWRPGASSIVKQTMVISQNACFCGPAQPADDEFRPGKSLAAVMAAALAHRGWQVSEPELWRDAGWSLRFSKGSARLEAVIAPARPEGWFLQVAPEYRPGLIGRLRGRAASATPEECHELAAVLHEVLINHGYRNFRWCWDGPPDDHSSDRPLPVRDSG